MKEITNEFLQNETTYKYRHLFKLTKKQLKFVNDLSFEKYGSGWQFLNSLNFACGNFDSALENNLCTYEHNVQVNNESRVSAQNFINLVVKHRFATIKFNDLVNFINFTS
jgi:hypothetical protein